MRIVFEKGDRGLICRAPEDGGAWVVPAHRERHAAPLVHGHIVTVEIVGISANGRLRFARVVEDITLSQEEGVEMIKKAAAQAATFDDLKGKKWRGLGLATVVSPENFDVKTCLDVDGRPAVEAVRVTGFLRMDRGKVRDAGVFSPEVEFERPLQLGPGDMPAMLAYLVVAHATPGHLSPGQPGLTWAAEFIARVRELSEAVRLLEERTGEKWYPREKSKDFPWDWPVMHWLRDEIKRTGATNLHELVARIELPLEAIRAQLATLIADRPAEVRFLDGRECSVKWDGPLGSVWVPREIFRTLTLDAQDARTLRIKEAGHALWLKTSWEVHSHGDRHNDHDSHTVGDRRRLI